MTRQSLDGSVGLSRADHARQRQVSGRGGRSCVPVRHGLRSPLIGVMLAAAALSTTQPALAEVDDSIAAEYDRLLAQGCVPAAFDVATAIEARVLRNLPFARAGLRFASAELTELYAADGDWYQPEHPRVVLDRNDQACVERLQLHEVVLRRQLPIDAPVEAVLTRDPAVFWSLRRHSRYPNQYRNARSRIDEVSWAWSFVDGAACGGDGSPEAVDDCAGVAIICSVDEEDSLPRCEVVLAG
jgi:hypothetical protein